VRDGATLVLDHESPVSVLRTDEDRELLHETGRSIELGIEELPKARIGPSFSNLDVHEALSLCVREVRVKVAFS
jgi:hypothetical protein